MVDRRSREYIAKFQKPQPPLRAIRMKCIECMGGTPMGDGTVAGGRAAGKDIEECCSNECPLWPFRLGTSPWKKGKRRLTEEQRAKLRENAEKARAAKHELSTKVAPRRGGHGGRAERDRQDVQE